MLIERDGKLHAKQGREHFLGGRNSSALRQDGIINVVRFERLALMSSIN